MLADRVRMGVYRFAEVVPSGPLPDIAVAPSLIVDFIPLAHEIPIVETDSITVAPGIIAVEFIPLTYEVPFVEDNSITIAPGTITVQLIDTSS